MYTPLIPNAYVDSTNESHVRRRTENPLRPRRGVCYTLRPMLDEFSPTAEEWTQAVSMRGDMRWLSNDHELDPPLSYDEKKFGTVEAAYKFEKYRQHMKHNAPFLVTCLDPKAKGSEVRAAERSFANLRITEQWEEARYGVMLVLNRLKYRQHPGLAEQLKATYPRVIVEITRPHDSFGNEWADTYWGMCVSKDDDVRNAKGRNGMGRIAMQVRQELMAL